MVALRFFIYSHLKINATLPVSLIRSIRFLEITGPYVMEKTPPFSDATEAYLLGACRRLRWSTVLNLLAAIELPPVQSKTQSKLLSQPWKVSGCATFWQHVIQVRTRKPRKLEQKEISCSGAQSILSESHPCLTFFCLMKLQTTVTAIWARDWSGSEGNEKLRDMS